MHLTLETVLLLSRYLVGACIAVSSLELLVEPSLVAPNGLLGWPLLVTAHRRRPQPFEGLRDAFFSQQGITTLHAVTFFLALMLFLPGLSPHIAGTLCLALLGTHVLMSYRSTFGGDGSDQMSNIVLAGLAFTFLASASGPVWLQQAGLWFIAIQCVISYSIAGIAKAISVQWRSGEAPRAILNSATYGSQLGVRLMDAFPHGSGTLAWLTIIIECLFPIVLFAPAPVVWFFLAMGIFFHLGNAVFMGLNTFLTAFAAAYPIVLFVNPHFR